MIHCSLGRRASMGKLLCWKAMLSSVAMPSRAIHNSSFASVPYPPVMRVPSTTGMRLCFRFSPRGILCKSNWTESLPTMIFSRRNFFSFFREGPDKHRVENDDQDVISKKDDSAARRRGRVGPSGNVSSFVGKLKENLSGIEYPFMPAAESVSSKSGGGDGENRDDCDAYSHNSSRSRKDDHDDHHHRKKTPWSKLIRFNSSSCPRSALFIPGHKPRALKKALGGIASDCFILDLEDSVGPTCKREARECIRHFLEVDVPSWREEVKLAYQETASHIDECIPPPPSPRFILRINSPDENMSTALLDLDFIASLGDRIEGVAIPKVSIDSFDKVKDYVHPEHSLWALFETPKSILSAREICGSNHYKAAVMGYNDLGADLQLPSSSLFFLDASASPKPSLPSSPTSTSPPEMVRKEKSGECHEEVGGSPISRVSLEEQQMLYFSMKFPLYFSAMNVLYSARSCRRNMFVLDGVFNDPTNLLGFQKDLRHCVALGFHGKTLIHPSQVGDTNKIYCPGEKEVEWAREVEAAVAASEGNVTTVRGKMVESLHVCQARRTLQLAENAVEEEKILELLIEMERSKRSKRN